jgi:hypothetical protein
MEVSIKVVSADANAQQGIELGIYDREDIHMGDLLIHQSELVWCPGKTPHRLGKKVSWASFIEFLESH